MWHYIFGEPAVIEPTPKCQLMYCDQQPAAAEQQAEQGGHNVHHRAPSIHHPHAAHLERHDGMPHMSDLKTPLDVKNP